MTQKVNVKMYCTVPSTPCTVPSTPLYRRIREKCSHCYQDNCQQCLFHLDLSASALDCNGFMGRDDYARHVASHLQYLEDHREDYHRIMTQVVIE